MTISMHQASAPVLAQKLEALSGVLQKAQAAIDAGDLDEAELMEARLAPDMFAFPRQVQIATDMAKNGVARLAGHEPPPYADTETTVGQLRERITRTVAYLKAVPSADIDGSENREITLKLGPERTMTFKGQPYLLGFVLPNFYFHAATAYDILRHKGVSLGKQDFIGAV